MRRVILLASTLLILVANARAESPVSLPPVSITDFRPVGEQRLWTFVVKDSTVGRLISTVLGPTQIGSQAGIGIAEQLSLNYQKVGSDLVMFLQSKHLMSSSNIYLGDHMTIKSADQTDTLELVRFGDSLLGFATHGGVRQPVNLSSPSTRSAWDPPFVDQIEMYLALHGVSSGEKIDDSVFAPQPMLAMPIRGTVIGFGQVNLYNKVVDSVFDIRLSQPQQMRLLFNRHRQLVKVEIPEQQTKIYLDAVTAAKAPTESKSPATPVIPSLKVVDRIPAFALYLGLGIIVLLFLIGRQITSAYGYFGFALSAAIFWLVPFTQVPLQEAIIVHKMLPAVKAGESVFLWAVWPALIAGIIQTSLLAGLMLLIRPEKKLGLEKMLVLGAFCGAGFGFMEACYFTATVPVFTLASYGLIERVFVLIYQASAGLLLGFGLRRGMAYYFQTALCLVLINALLRYLPAFAQQRVVGPDLLAVLLALVSLAVLLSALLFSKKSTPIPARPHSKTTP